MDTRNIRLIIAYDGTCYHGWQRQNREATIQGRLEETIQLMVREPVTLIASGRTDAGVHAYHQVCNFHTSSSIGPDALRRGLNSLLPDDIVVRHASYAPPSFHARYRARGKVYEYRILNRPDPDIFLRRYVWHIRQPLDTGAMAGSLSLLRGTHDFSS